MGYFLYICIYTYIMLQLAKVKKDYKGVVLSFKAQAHMLCVTVVRQWFTSATTSVPHFWTNALENKLNDAVPKYWPDILFILLCTKLAFQRKQEEVGGICMHQSETPGAESQSSLSSVRKKNTASVLLSRANHISVRLDTGFKRHCIDLY